MIQAYTFNTQYNPVAQQRTYLPSLRLLEGGRFAPGEFAPVLLQGDEQIRLQFMQWGLISGPAGRRVPPSGMLYAPASQAINHPAFRQPFMRQRCLIPTDGFYLSAQHGPREAGTFKVQAGNQPTFCFAGLYDQYVQADGTVRHSFAIMTTPAQGSFRRFNLQMPLILPRWAEQPWLNPTTPMGHVAALLQKPVTQRLDINPVLELALQGEPQTWEQVAA
ncbi:MAG: SOS response-associated peptidase family protein [Bacteroidota bacterium]